MKLPIKLIAILAAVLPLVSCETSVSSTGIKTSKLNSQSQQVLTNAGKVLGPALVDSLFAVGQQELSGSGVSKEQLGFTVANSLWKNINNVNSTSDVKDLMVQSAGNNLPDLVNAATKAYLKSSNPDSAAKVNAIAAVVSTAAGAPPPPVTVK